MIAAPGEDRSPALALVNSRHASATGTIDHLDGPSALREWLATTIPQAGSPRPVSAADVRRLHELRAAVRAVLSATVDAVEPDRGAVATVNAAAVAAPGGPQLRWSTDGPERAWQAVDGGPLDRACAIVAADAIDLVCGARRERLAACPAPGCVRLFLRDHGRRRWCSIGCGDRVRAARYYARHR